MDINLKEAQKKALETNIYINPLDCALNLISEAGEVAGKISKVYRDNGGVFSDVYKLAILDELGDVWWQVSVTAYMGGIEFDDNFLNHIKSELYNKKFLNVRLTARSIVKLTIEAFDILYEYITDGSVDTNKYKNRLRDTLAIIIDETITIGSFLGFRIEEIIRRNQIKLADRKKRNMIKGSGDNR